MIINKKLFDECWCPCPGIARVCLDGSAGIPKQLEKYGREKEKNKENYSESCFSIDIVVENRKPVCALVNYMASDEMYSEIPCYNYKQAFEYYKNNASDMDLEETFSL